jgi:hypothetical protein
LTMTPTSVPSAHMGGQARPAHPPTSVVHMMLEGHDPFNIATAAIIRVLDSIDSVLLLQRGNDTIICLLHPFIGDNVVKVPTAGHAPLPYMRRRPTRGRRKQNGGTSGMYFQAPLHSLCRSRG